jgi:hypothetical protein
MEQLKSSDEVLEPSPDRLLASQISNQVMEALKQSNEAAYKVWILLSTRFGAGQKL